MQTGRDIFLREDGPREGFQMLAKTVPTADKLRLIELLSRTGVAEIEVTSFVRPDRVPQLADSDQLCRALNKRPDVNFHALYLNEKGFLRSLEHQSLTPRGIVLLSASEPFLIKNNNQTIEQALALLPKWCELFKAHQVPFSQLMLSNSFGDSSIGKVTAARVVDLCEQALSLCPETTIHEITFADTTGWANPRSVTTLVKTAAQRFPATTIGLHLHDTRGLGVANVLAGIEAGVTHFDCSVGGMGGCPFAAGAGGNVATEEVAFLCEELGLKTGIDLATYLQCVELLEQILGISLPSKLRRGGLLK